MVSLSSSESELHALVSGACDGIFIKSTMMFLVNEEVHHACLLDNSSTRQIAQKRGSGKLRHVSGKLLWCQNKVATKEMEVIQVSTSKNISDIGTKALSQMRLKLLMFWCNMRSADGARIGEQEFQEEEERQRQKGNVMRLAKLLNRMVLLGGLGQATAERMSIEEELLQQQPEETWRRWLAVILFLIVLMLVGFINLVRKEKRLRDEVENIRNEQERLQMELREQRAEQSRCESMTHDYIENVHLGLVAMGGYLDPALPSLTEADRHQRSFLQMGNRTRDILRLGRQRRSYIRGILRRRNESPVSSRSAGEEVLSGDTATVRLDSGEVVEVPVEYVSPIAYEPRSTSLAAEGSPEREPEPEGESQVRQISPMREESGEDEEQTEDENAEEQTSEVPIDGEEETLEEQTLSQQIFGRDPDFTQISMRAMLRARIEMTQLQRHMTIAHQTGDSRLIVQRAMENVVPFMDAEIEN